MIYSKNHLLKSNNAVSMQIYNNWRSCWFEISIKPVVD